MFDIESHEFIRSAAGSDVKQAVVRELRAYLDPVLLPAGFTVAAKSGDYRRKSASGSQVLRNYLNYTGTAPFRLDAKLGPQLELTYSQANAQIERYAPAVAEVRTASFTEAIFVGPFLGRGSHWYFSTLGELRTALAGSLVPAIATELLPLLDKCTTVEGFADLADEGASRLIKAGRGKWEYWAAAKMVCGDVDGAGRVLREHFKPGTRDGEELKFLVEEIERRRTARGQGD